ncbi:hypothetical protein D1AOALGA4SA_9457 [Olavius algarvensis Delta 1 endosymbiont]|nr:hypothetical protein D1AOALGA4SA_9457 [Olavius algarvensis Delta 1 endosymbiont]
MDTATGRYQVSAKEFDLLRQRRLKNGLSSTDAGLQFHPKRGSRFRIR